AIRHNLYSFGDVIAGAVETTAFQARFRGILKRHSRENQRRVRVASSAHPVSSHVLAELHDPETGRLYAGRIASFLGTPLSNLAKFSQVSVAGLHKSPRSVSVQPHRSEEHTSELQSRSDLVCRLLLEKKKKHQQH